MVDESTLFIPAHEVHVHSQTNTEQMSAWEEGSYFDYRVCRNDDSGGHVHDDGRLIEVRDQHMKSTWYLVSNAWLLGPDGKTIEHLT